MEETLKKVLSELEMIRKIKMIELMERGYSQSKLGSALGISQATVSRMMTGKPKAVKDKGATSDSDE
jgi:predicted transcriptional regulator